MCDNHEHKHTPIPQQFIQTQKLSSEWYQMIKEAAFGMSWNSATPHGDKQSIDFMEGF